MGADPAKASLPRYPPRSVENSPDGFSPPMSPPRGARVNSAKVRVNIKPIQTDNPWDVLHDEAPPCDHPEQEEEEICTSPQNKSVKKGPIVAWKMCINCWTILSPTHKK